MSDYNDTPAHMIKASRILQAKVGSGDIHQDRIQKSQIVIDQNDTDFVPMAKEFLARLEQALIATPTAIVRGQDAVQEVIQPIITEVMQLKANAGMFDYTLVSTLAGVMLNFLETLQRWDQDAFDIVDAHRRSLLLIISEHRRGDGGAYGTQLTQELREACLRYFIKNAP